MSISDNSDCGSGIKVHTELARQAFNENPLNLEGTVIITLRIERNHTIR